MADRYENVIYFRIMSDEPSCSVDLMILDGDDTLWESAVYFQRAEQDFLLLMESLGHPSSEIRPLVHRMDLQRLSSTGYGALPYLQTLREVMSDRLNPPAWAERAMDSIQRNLIEHPVILLPSVLTVLEAFHELDMSMVVYTMGEFEHQHSKFLRSGLENLVSACHIPRRKSEKELERLLARHGASSSRTVLVGNSPKSDINPALAVGVNAVHLERASTWAAELEDYVDPDMVHRISGFDELPAVLHNLELIDIGLYGEETGKPK